VPDVVGKPYRDGSGNAYLPMFRQPVVVLSATAAIFTEELFDTPHDEVNRAVVEAVAADDLRLVGMALRADRRVVDKVVDGLNLHP
jgi:hypothetical protein